ncbi:RNA-directed DNA polymerase [Operophtera brumata]|uniref:RNA-directed DNA polymerase n=1 Tax=Operophtera brumata TaxID=104452 RepID=A0A0L7KG98_OPEBR|nr:RNA-directed DNA polymerase [Operophtera brumata]
MKDDNDHQAYKIAKKIAKRAVAQAKATARDDFYAQLETASNDKEIFKLEKRKHQMKYSAATEGPISCIWPEEITLAIKRMANNKASAPNDIPAEFWKQIGDTGVLFLTKLFNKFLVDGIPYEWRKGFLIPFFKNKGKTKTLRQL